MQAHMIKMHSNMNKLRQCLPEFSYHRSRSPTDLMRILAITKPADFFNFKYLDVDNYKYNTEFNQYLVNNKDHLVLSEIPI
jgi:hypothetical protein